MPRPVCTSTCADENTAEMYVYVGYISKMYAFVRPFDMGFDTAANGPKAAKTLAPAGKNPKTDSGKKCAKRG